MPIDHIGLAVGDFARSRAFYLAALAPIGMTIVQEGESWAMLGKDGAHEFWIGAGKTATPIHLAFKAETRAEVRAFHAAALLAGGKDNGAPGIRGHYHADYFGAFIIDPDGHNIEAVCHQTTA